MKHSTEVGNKLKINGQLFQIGDKTPTGRQLLEVAGLQPATEYAILHWPLNGPTREIGLEEVIKLDPHVLEPEFFGIRADGIYYFTLDDVRYAWAGSLTEDQVRKICRVPANLQLWLERQDEPDLQLESGAEINLSASGVERLYTRKHVWKLDVQGVVIDSAKPAINVRDALQQAGINPDQGWIIILKVKDQPKQEVALSYNIDLTQPGIERLRLTPKQINNGECATAPRRHFSILPQDELYLDKRKLKWETVNNNERRWLLIENFQLPVGYNQSHCCVAIEIPTNYPMAELDMFYCYPPIERSNGVAIPQTESQQVIDGTTFQRWSRHRISGAWSPQNDSLITHLMLVEESISREVE